MAINYIPGPESLLAPAAREITEGVMKFINPNRDFQLGMQRALATNPQLISQLSDIEHSAPGALDRLGFGPLSPIIKSLPETPEAEVRRTGRETIVKGKTLDLESEVTKSEITNNIIRKAAEEIAKNSDLTAEAVYQQIIGKTKSEAIVQQEAARAAPARADADIAASNLSASVINDTIQDLPEIGQTDLYETARNFRAGRLDDYSLIASIYRTPGARETFDNILAKLARDEQYEQQRELTNLRVDQSQTDRENMFWWQRAGDRYRTSNAGSIGTWEKYLRMNADDRAEVARLIDQEPKNLSLEQRELREVAIAERDMFLARTEAAQRTFTRDLQLMMGRVRRVANDAHDKSENNPLIAGELAPINDLLRQHEERTGRSMRARFGKIPGTTSWRRWFGERGLYLEDESGNVVEPEELLSVAGPSDTGENDIRNSQIFEVTVTDLTPLSPAEREFQLNRMQGVVPPALYQAIKDYFENFEEE